MDAYKKITAIVLAGLLICSCAEEPAILPDPLDNLSEKERSLLGNWRYQGITIQDIDFPFASFALEPSRDQNDAGGVNSQLQRRGVNYSMERTYQLRWVDRGTYELGTEGDPNWQPNFGSWQISGDTLIHNPGLAYETKYLLGITGDFITRYSMRYMSSNGETWSPEDTVLFIERFVRDFD